MAAGLEQETVLPTNPDRVIRPAVRPGVDGMPVADARRQPLPFARALGDVQHGVEHLQVGQFDVAALNARDRRDAFVLSLCNLHSFTGRPPVLETARTEHPGPVPGGLAQEVAQPPGLVTERPHLRRVERDGFACYSLASKPLAPSTNTVP